MTETSAVKSADDGLDSSFLGARRALAAAIRRGDYSPNQRLVESELTVSLGVSRGTLRTVFIALEQENYISLERNRGARVRQFGPEEALEILETREILESAAAGLAAIRITRDELAGLESTMAAMIEFDSLHDGVQYSRCNKEFHAQIVVAARQPTLSRFISSTPYPLVMSQYRNAQAQHPRTGSLYEHQAILAALRIGNAVAAEAAMRHHVASARRALTLNIASAADGAGSSGPAGLHSLPPLRVFRVTE